MNTADVCVLAVLLLFAVWGALRGALRQLMTVLVIGAGLFVATRFGSAVATTVSKVAGLDGSMRDATAWVVVFVATLVAGAVLFSFLGGWFETRRTDGALRRGLGAALGLVTGIGVLFVAGYAVLGYPHGPSGGPSLQRVTGVADAAEDPASTESAWLRSTRDSRAAAVLADGGEAVRRSLSLPSWMCDWMDRVASDVERGAR